MRFLKIFEKFISSVVGAEEEPPLIVTNDEILDTFISLTKKTIVAGKEDLIKDYLINLGFTRDSFGNFFIHNPNSRVLVTAHADSYCKSVEYVKHIVTDDKIATDGSTILGADNKAGICYIESMIKSNKNYNYYIFAQEEIGRLGSIYVLNNQKSFIENIDLCITFDRRGNSELITYQSGEKCCSDKTSSELINMFSEHGVNLIVGYGAKSDTYTFRNVIRECVNISSGAVNEHNTNEYLDLKYFKKIYEIVKQIDFNTISINRDFNEKPSKIITPFTERINKRMKLGDNLISIRSLSFGNDFYKFILEIDGISVSLKFHKDADNSEAGVLVPIIWRKKGSFYKSLTKTIELDKKDPFEKLSKDEISRIKEYFFKRLNKSKNESTIR